MIKEDGGLLDGDVGEGAEDSKTGVGGEAINFDGGSEGGGGERGTLSEDFVDDADKASVSSGVEEGDAILHRDTI